MSCFIGIEKPRDAGLFCGSLRSTPLAGTFVTRFGFSTCICIVEVDHLQFDPLARVVMTAAEQQRADQFDRLLGAAARADFRRVAPTVGARQFRRRRTPREWITLGRR